MANGDYRIDKIKSLIKDNFKIYEILGMVDWKTGYYHNVFDEIKQAYEELEDEVQPPMNLHWTNTTASLQITRNMVPIFREYTNHVYMTLLEKGFLIEKRNGLRGKDPFLKSDDILFYLFSNRCPFSSNCTLRKRKIQEGWDE